MFSNIQVLRAVAALMVVFDHWADHYGGSLQQVGLLGSTGVDIFFVISGFVMVRSTWDRKASPQSFAVNRLIRIVPLYWMGTFAVLVAALVMPTAFRSTEAAVVPLLKSLAFVPYLKTSGLVQPLLFPGWTLNYEMFFYALFAVSLYVKTREARTALLLSFLCVLVVIGQIAHPAGVLAGFYTMPIILEFGYGVLLGAGLGRGALPASAWRGGWWLLGLGFVGLLVMQPLFAGVDRGFKVGPFALLIVYAAVELERQGVAVRSKWVLLLGAASYAVYLVHPFAGAAVFLIVTRLPLLPGVGVAVSAFLTFTVTVAAGVLVHLWIERPVSHWLRARFVAVRSTVARRQEAITIPFPKALD